jgi:hypothetical protein
VHLTAYSAVVEYFRSLGSLAHPDTTAIAHNLGGASTRGAERQLAKIAHGGGSTSARVGRLGASGWFRCQGAGKGNAQGRVKGNTWFSMLVEVYEASKVE